MYADGDLRKLCEMMQGQSSIKRPTAPMEASLKQYHHLSDRDLNSQVTQYIESLEDTCKSSCKSDFLHANPKICLSLPTRLRWSCTRP